MKNFNFVEGIVLDTSDPQQMGRIKVWCPSVDGENYNIDLLPWVTYLSPLAGQTKDYPAGSNTIPTKGLLSYGFWAIPKQGALVIIGFLYGDVNCRFYLGSYFRDHGNRSLPTGRNRSDLGAKAPVSDTFEPIEPQTENLLKQFNNKLNALEAITRGTYERQIGHDKDIRDGTEGYQKGVVNHTLDSQTYCLTTPGRHVLLFQDNPSNARVRLKTADGHQIILDDANERIYISTTKGNTWIELDSDGHIHLHGGESISISAGKDINLSAGKDVSISAGGNLNLSSKGHVRMGACSDISISGGIINITSEGGFNILAAGDILQTGTTIHLNGPNAAIAPCPGMPSIIPSHEPWKRPVSKSRNKNWKA